MSSAAASKSKKKDETVKNSTSEKKESETKEKPEKKKNEFENEPPFGTDYAKTGRSHCKSCNEAIPKGKLRIATRAPSYRYHGMMENWYHEPCFPWEKAITDGISEAKIRGLESIEKDDQEKILKKLKETAKNGGQKEADSGSSGASKRKSDVKNEEGSSTKKPKKAAAASGEK